MNGENIGLFLKRNLHSRIMRIAGLGILMLACQLGKADAAIEPPKCPGDVTCYKEIRVVNNTDGPIYAVVQGSKQLNPALGNCLKGDTWLQRALKNTTECFPVKRTYYIYINPTKGIPKGATASISLPWWSQPAGRVTDKYVDWWRGGRIYIFDDQTALNDSFKVNSGRQGQPVTFVGGSPLVTCSKLAKNVCDSTDLKIYKVNDDLVGSSIETKSPLQLNEWTFADVTDPALGGELLTLNLNYNVSNVDQIYLPVAMEPINVNGPPVGYMGSTMLVKDFRAKLVSFTGANADQTNATNWPIYNNPVNKTTNKKRYPNAGIRVPSTLTLFSFYMNPSFIDGNTALPEIIPLPKPFDRTKLPKYVAAIETNWTNCTTSPFTNCPLKDWYTPIKQAFDKSYKDYFANCQPVPPYLDKVKNDLPSPEAYLRFVHGWVPFRVDPVGNIGFCTPAKVPDLPKTEQPPAELGYAPVNYIKIQYDYEPPLNAKIDQQFNVYTKLVHVILNASAYAFSIDDHESFQNHPGTGLIFAIGGGAGLPIQKRVPPAIPQFYEWYTAGVSLGPGTASLGWNSYGICSDVANRDFANKLNPNTIGLNPKTTPVPCTITLTDTKARKYQIKILQMNATGPLPFQIWPEFTPTGAKPNDPKVVACPLNDDWCKVGVNETAHLSDPTKKNKAPTFTLGTRVPQ